MTDKTEAQRLAAKCGSLATIADAYDAEAYAEAAALLLKQEAAIKVLREALEHAGLFLHHAWCDVQMNDYSFEKLNTTMGITDAALTATEGL